MKKWICFDIFKIFLTFTKRDVIIVIKKGTTDRRLVHYLINYKSNRLVLQTWAVTFVFY